MEPEILEPEILDKQLLDLKKRQKELVTELGEKKIAMCTALDEAINLRFGAEQANQCKLTKAKIAEEQAKTQ